MRTYLILSLISVGLAAFAQAAQPETHVVKLGAHTFTLPKGFAIERVAGSPRVERPVNGSFDEQGRLYVSDSSGSNAKPTEQLKNPTHRIVRLESSKKDGVYDKSVVFADKLSFLQGTLWHQGSLYVGAPPVILKLTDTDGDGVADKREVWFDGKSLTGCANDLHGPYLGPDGKIYWTKGGFGTQAHTLEDGRTFKTKASHIFRADVDGKNLEVVMTGGMDNPVGVAWVKNDLFFSTTFFQHPEAGKRDGLIHNTYGALYGKDHECVDGYIRTGPKFSEPMTHLGPAAPSGLVAYRHSQFGEEFRENLFCAQFNMSKVSRHILKPKGATYETVDSDFVTSDNRDFHPTDVIVAPDGSLIILDTGGWYKLCCPSSQLANKEVLGAIYRVTRTSIGPASIAKAIREKVDSPELVERDLRDRYSSVLKVANSAKFKSSAPRFLEALSLPDNDSVLDAALTRGLIDIADVVETRRGLTNPSPRVLRAVLVALEQIPGAKLTFAEVQAHLDSKDANLNETAWWIAGRHPDWGQDLAASFAKAMQSGTEVSERIVPFTGNADVQTMLADNISQVVAVEVMGRAKLKSMPSAWRNALGKTLVKPDTVPPLRRAEWTLAALTALRAYPTAALPPEDFETALQTIFRDAKQPERERLLALLVAKPTDLDSPALKFVLGELDAEKPATLRSDAADVLLNAKLTSEQSREVVGLLPKVSLLDLDKLLKLFAKNADEIVGLSLLKVLDTQTLRAALRSEQLKPIFAGYPKSVQAEASKFFDKLDDGLKAQRAGLDKFLVGTQPGDGKRGQMIFNSAKTNCATCHKIGYVGGMIGPDLSRIGSIRVEKDLLESIVLPSASFVRSYEPVQVVRLDGRSHSGILKKDAPDEIVLTISATEDIRIPRGDIDTFKAGTVSIMPAGLDQQLTKQELADLLAFLKGLK